MTSPPTPLFPPSVRAHGRILNALESITLERAYHECARAASKGRWPQKKHDDILKKLIKKDADFDTIQEYLDRLRLLSAHRKDVQLLKENLPGFLHDTLDRALGLPAPLESCSSDEDGLSEEEGEPATFELSKTFIKDFGSWSIERTPKSFREKL